MLYINDINGKIITAHCRSMERGKKFAHCWCCTQCTLHSLHWLDSYRVTDRQSND